MLVLFRIVNDRANESESFSVLLDIGADLDFEVIEALRERFASESSDL